ncbi:MAG: cysteine hydrolase [Chloroflexi bacterium]|nr:cysteine hydrolase [Chloroflexota bacterium]
MIGKIPWDTGHRGAYTLKEWSIDPERSALLIIDMQRGYIDPGWGIGTVLRRGYPKIYDYYHSRLAQKVLPNILALRDFFRDHKLEIFYTRMGFQLPEARDLPEHNWRRALLRQQEQEERSVFFKESREYEIVEALQPLPGEVVLDKNSLNPFNSTPLAQVLHNMSLENLIITGVLTNGAVESTARTGGDRGYNTVVVEDACAAYSRDEDALRIPPPSSFVPKPAYEMIRNLRVLLAAK